MEKKIKNIYVIQDIRSPEYIYSPGRKLHMINNRWGFLGELYDAQYFIDRREWFKVTYEDEQPKRVRQIFEFEYDNGNNLKVNEKFLKCSMKSRNSNYEYVNLYIRELQTTKSKQELIKKARQLMMSDTTERWFGLKCESIIDLINSHYPDSDGWTDEDMIDFSRYRGFNIANFKDTKDCLEYYKNSKGKNENTNQ